MGAPPTFEHNKRLREFLLKYPCVKVVVHSNWRLMNYSEHEVGDFLDLEDALADRFIGVTPVSHPSRWESIQEWLKTKMYKGAFAILDDMHNSFGPEAREHLISPHYSTGMTEVEWKALEEKVDASLQYSMQKVR